MAIERYGQTKSEKEADQFFQCRQIVQEILEFGVSQKQILRIIKLLSLELEDRNALESLAKTVKDIENSKQNQTKIIT